MKIPLFSKGPVGLAAMTLGFLFMISIAPARALATSCEDLFQKSPVEKSPWVSVEKDLISSVDRVLEIAIPSQPAKKFVQLEAVRYFNSSPTGAKAVLYPDGYWAFATYVHYNIIFLKPRTNMRSQLNQVTVAHIVKKSDGLDRPSKVVRIELGYDSANFTSETLRILAEGFTKSVLQKTGIVPLAGASQAGSSVAEIILDGLSKRDADKAIAFMIQLAALQSRPVRDFR